MITQVRIKNFKRFDDVTVPLGAPVVFVGPNNSGKTTALQALALWELGLRRWLEKRAGAKSKATQRVGVNINRHDLVQLPVPNTAHLWRELHLREKPRHGATPTQNILIEICVDGISEGAAWSCPLEFDYANDEIIRCRPGRLANTDQRSTIPEQARRVRVAYLPPMSGLAAYERRIDEGAIHVSLGEGQTAQVLRNLCWKLWENEHTKDAQGEWGSLVAQLQRLFGVEISAPQYVPERGEIRMSYRDLSSGGRRGSQLDLSAAGRGFQQTLLLLAFLRWKPGTVLLIDEPDAHLEILRQRQIYAEITATARRLQSQIIIATHSEVVLNEAARDTIVAFVGTPHPMRHPQQLLKALSILGYEQFLQAEIKGWVLYLEGSTDLAALQALASAANHTRAMRALDNPFVCYVLNQPAKAREHFYGLHDEAFPNLRGLALFDNSPGITLHTGGALREILWPRREIENYFCQPFLLTRWAAQSQSAADLFGHAQAQRHIAAMQHAIRLNTIPRALNDPSDPFWSSCKVSDDYLPAIFSAYFAELGLPNAMNKSDFSQLAALLKPDEIHPDVHVVLDAIADTAAVT